MFDDACDALECQVCGAEHDEAIHEATLSVHRWFHDEVTKYFFEDVDAEACVA